MMRHIIQKQVVELSLDEMEKFHEVADTFNDMIQHSVLPRLSTQFDKLSDEQIVITADHIEIDLGVISDWERQKDKFSDQLVELIVKIIADLINDRIDQNCFPASTDIVPVPIRQWVAWKQYLETGSMPWFGTTASQQEWETILIDILNQPYQEYIKDIISEVIVNPQAKKRLILVFSSAFIDKIICATGRATEDRFLLVKFSQWLETEMKISKGALEKIAQEFLLDNLSNEPEISYIAILEKLTWLYPYQNWRAIVIAINKLTRTNFFTVTGDLQRKIDHFIKVLLSSVSESEFRKIIRDDPETASMENHFSSHAFKIINDKRTPVNKDQYTLIETLDKDGTSISSIKSQKNDLILIPEKEGVNQDEALYVPYAGLVITAVFLPMFFDAVGLLKEGTFSSVESQVKAVRLTGFLGSGQTDTPDWELVVPKILCGLDPSATINMDEPLDQGSLLEAEKLLKALIRHWNALGYCSTDGLREGFLDRNGKLTSQQDNWLLQVESKAIDILLEKISWGFGTIKLPWIQKMLITEWNI